MTSVPCLCCGPVACFFRVTQWRRTSCRKMCSLRSVVSDSSLGGFLMSVTHLHGLHLKCVSACKLTSLCKKKASARQREMCTIHLLGALNVCIYLMPSPLKKKGILNLNKVIHHQQSFKKSLYKMISSTSSWSEGWNPPKHNWRSHGFWSFICQSVWFIDRCWGVF